MNSGGVRLIVRGVVQGVGYRYFVYRAARHINLTGFTKNMPDGSVVVEAYGERSQLEILIQELKVGPASATVSAVDITWLDPSSKYTNFDISG